MVKARHWTRPEEFHGEVKESDLKLVEENLSEDLKDGEVLCEAVYLTVDPYMRMHGSVIGERKTMFGAAVSKVIKTRNGEFPLGTLVLSGSGWRTHFISKDGKDLKPIPFDLGNLSPSVALGVLGMPGLTAYFGLNRKLEPKSGDVCLVNGAAGAVGSIVGQLAKLKGCTVIGFAGTDDKCEWLKQELGFDHAFNYKKIKLEDALKQAAPKGVDIFFDNIGGDFFHEMIDKHMAQNGRVYPQINMKILFHELTIRGIIVSSHYNEAQEALAEMSELVKKGQLKYKETLFDGFDKMPEAFVGLFKGENTGKAVIKASNYP
ncbi:unnamed protein product [Didymodactylos carnosus]|uniref:15-oxoprostaglandin 13-reductase n=1 Tax=Didymodactylos carnosus TaxID=1234261 RepID=A0A814DCD4_9BILA|nr:unnamed protein product [Didymodactylos carnosus]CAF0988943.1 unnamed protein product [Didymodactylos carnosus]CAF3728839.1 unnamed protein product [Didymodactylos carnosus]CAF3759075.1 unnamed protein product [Didymodactylos carnosus]